MVISKICNLIIACCSKSRTFYVNFSIFIRKQFDIEIPAPPFTSNKKSSDRSCVSRLKGDNFKSNGFRCLEIDPTASQIQGPNNPQHCSYPKLPFLTKWIVKNLPLGNLSRFSFKVPLDDTLCYNVTYPIRTLRSFSSIKACLFHLTFYKGGQS